MQSDQCNVCSGTDLKLIDGFYYCVECGTQNKNVQETVLDQQTLGDGTFGVGIRKKLHLEDSKIQMSEEWYKWHAFNFIICSLADELITLGAKPTFKTKLLWIWTRYIKKFQNKEALRSNEKGNTSNTANLTTFFIDEEEDSNNASDQETEEIATNGVKVQQRHNISCLTRSLVVSMLYLALNFDESPIQPSHMYRFIEEKQLSVETMEKFVPKEIPIQPFSKVLCYGHLLRHIAVCLINELDLGTPIVPDLKKIVNNYLLELCLPNDLKSLVFSLMCLRPCNFLDIDSTLIKYVKRIPDYEITVMSYILVALKMCFGLDSNYELKLSDVVDKINDERDLPKSHRVGKYSEPTSRLFSFREWCNYLQYRNMMLNKYRPLTIHQHYMDINYNAYFEHYKPDIERKETGNSHKRLAEDICMDLINKIPLESDDSVIPKASFPPSVTPMSDYTNVIVEHTQDYEKRLLLSEDFTNYSLKYAIDYLDLKDFTGENVIKGVSKEGKIYNKVIYGSIVTKKSKTEMVYVKNCENINWRKTNPPTLEHVVCDENAGEVANKDATCSNNSTVEANDKESDHGYDSEPPPNDADMTSNQESNPNDTETTSNLVKDPNDTETTSNQEKDPNEAEAILNQEIDPNDTETRSNQEINNDTDENVIGDSNDKADEPKQGEEEIINDSHQNTEPNKYKIVDEKHKVIVEEDPGTNIFDDLFEDLNLKDEISQEHIDEQDIDNEEQIVVNTSIRNDDIDNLSDCSDVSESPFNPGTFDREKTIKECILAACKKYKIPIPAQYKETESRKRIFNQFTADDDVPKAKRNKLKPGESKKRIEALIGDYYNNLKLDFIHNVQQELNIAIQKTNLTELLNQTEHGPMNQEQSFAISGANSVFGDENNAQMDQDELNIPSNSNNEGNITLDDTNGEDLNANEENIEETLFDKDDVMRIDDLLPKNDPKFDEEKYDTEQLYLKINNEDDADDQVEDPEIKELIDKKIKEIEHMDLDELKTIKPTKDNVQDTQPFDLEDDEPLSVVKKKEEEVKKKFQEMDVEETFDNLIKQENLQEFKYWFRHYNTLWMGKTIDMTYVFDDELKKNTPASFYFVISECARVINCSTFILYKNMQRLEQYLLGKVKSGSSEGQSQSDSEGSTSDEEVT